MGVPHIYGNTDAETAYGLAWAHAEDDFQTIQEPFLAAKTLLASVKGKEGALLDAVAFLVDADGIVEEKYETDFSDSFKKVLEGYAEGLNSFAKAHPKEILHPDLFPIEAKNIIKGLCNEHDVF